MLYFHICSLPVHIYTVSCVLCVCVVVVLFVYFFHFDSFCLVPFLPVPLLFHSLPSALSRVRKNEEQIFITHTHRNYTEISLISANSGTFPHKPNSVTSDINGQPNNHKHTDNHSQNREMRAGSPRKMCGKSFS